MSDDLIDRLAGDLTPVSPHAVERRLALALFVGGVIALGGVVIGMGLRRDMPDAVSTPMFWIKIGYTLMLGLVGAWATDMLARPAEDARRRLAVGLLPLLLIASVALWQMLSSPPAAHRALIMGTSAAYCPWLILLTAAPLFAALVWAMRGLAPVRLRTAGTVAGLTAGATGASLYALHCPEVGAPFVAIWYTLGIAAAGLFGRLTGPWLLRW